MRAAKAPDLRTDLACPAFAPVILIALFSSDVKQHDVLVIHCAQAVVNRANQRLLSH